MSKLLFMEIMNQTIYSGHLLVMISIQIFKHNLHYPFLLTPFRYAVLYGHVQMVISSAYKPRVHFLFAGVPNFIQSVLGFKRTISLFSSYPIPLLSRACFVSPRFSRFRLLVLMRQTDFCYCVL